MSRVERAGNGLAGNRPAPERGQRRLTLARAAFLSGCILATEGEVLF